MEKQISGVAEKAKIILRLVGTGGLIVGSLAVPNLASAVAPLLTKKSRLKTRDAEAGIRYAAKRGWVAYRERDDQFELYLTKTGKARWQKVELDKALTARRWDGKWRIVIFDISSKRRLRRDALRNHLKKVGFRQLQESVWVSPYECSDLITALKLIYTLRDDEVRLVEASSFDGERAFAELFRIA